MIKEALREERNDGKLELAVVGGSEFVVGFQLAGIKKVFEVDGNPDDMVRQAMSDSSVGIIIIDEPLLSRLDERGRESLNASVRPVAVPMSTEASQDSLRKMIKKSIGVDLWGE